LMAAVIEQHDGFASHGNLSEKSDARYMRSAPDPH
jgi:hypothetical protein